MNTLSFCSHKKFLNSSTFSIVFVDMLADASSSSVLNLAKTAFNSSSLSFLLTSCIFSSAEFTSFVVFDQPLREYYDPVVLVIDTKNTSNTIDDEVIKVKDRKRTDINSTGGDIYEFN